MSHLLDKLVREARDDFGKRAAEEVDWTAIDAALFARIEREAKAERARFFPAPSRLWKGAAVGVAAAAAVVGLLLVKGRESSSLEGPTVAVPESAGTVVAVDGRGSALVDGRAVSQGATLQLGDVIDASGGLVLIERAGKLTLLLERGSRATVTHVQGSLVLALERGAVEAQVAPVASGEAFAVDVGTARVAVHGTHLRVARAGARVAVDLNEGVVSVGEAPRAGSVIGALVTAPAHAEFEASDALGTLTVSHEESTVRPPVTFSAPHPAPRADQTSALESAPPKVEASQPHPAGTAGAVARTELRPSPSAQAPLVDPNAEGTVAAAVRACMAERPRPENVTVVVSTTLHLELGDDGAVHTARFEPPVAPDVNGCAAPSIYHTRFPHGGSATIRIDFQD